MKRETKIYSRDPQAQSEGSFWELCIFAVFFVVVFTVLARTAHAAPLSKAQRSRAAYAKNDPNLIAQASPTATADDDMTVNPTRTTIPTAIPTGALPRANVSAGLPLKDSNKRFVISSSFIIDTAGTFAPDRAEDRAMSGEYTLRTGVTDQKNNITALIQGGYGREYTFELEDGQDGDIVDPTIAVVKSFREGHDFRSPIFDAINVGLGGFIGASRESARGTFVGSIGPSIGVTKRIHRLNLGQKFGYSRRFYNYDIRNDGTINAPDAITSTTDISYGLTDTLAISASTLLTYAVNFQGTGETRELSALSLDWSISPALGTSLGVATRRGTISDEGTYNTVKFVDDSVAQGFFDLILNF